MTDWKERAEALALKKEIEDIRDDLNRHHRNVNISQTTGNSVAIATGVPAAACAIAAPFTFGVTLIPAIVLGIIAAVGGGVSVSASVAEIFIKRHNVKDVQSRWETFREKFLASREESSELDDIVQILNSHTASNTADNPYVRTGLQGAGEAVRTARSISSAVIWEILRATPTGIRFTAPLLSVVSAVAIPLDIYDLVTSTLRLRRGSPSTATESLTQIIEFLDSVANGSFSEFLDNDLENKIPLGLDSSLDCGDDSGNEHGREKSNNNENNDESDPLILDSDNFFVQHQNF